MHIEFHYIQSCYREITLTALTRDYTGHVQYILFAYTRSVHVARRISAGIGACIEVQTYIYMGCFDILAEEPCECIEVIAFELLPPEETAAAVLEIDVIFSVTFVLRRCFLLGIIGYPDEDKIFGKDNVEGRKRQRRFNGNKARNGNGEDAMNTS